MTRHRRPRIWRLFTIISAYAALGSACALSFAFLRSAFATTFKWPTPYTFGYGPTSAQGTVWMWGSSSTFGWHVCRADVNDAAAPRQIVTPMGPVGWHVGPAPWWSIASEQPVPPSDWKPATATGINVILDHAFGWPWPCARYREHQLSRVPTAAEDAAMGLKSDGTQYMQQTLLLGSHRFAGFLTNFGIYDGYWPTNILWRGLAANTAAIGTMLALPHLGLITFRIYRSHRRRRSGKCPWCGYSRQGLAPDQRCPECGGAEPPQH